jgi:hypothetical protein
MHSNVTLRFMVQALQDPPYCSTQKSTSKVNHLVQESMRLSERPSIMVHFGQIVTKICQLIRLTTLKPLYLFANLVLEATFFIVELGRLRGKQK